jgi:hypothetical protein
MAMTALKQQPFPLFDFGIRPSTMPAIGTSVFVLDAANKAAAIGFQAPASGNIDKIGFYVSAHTTGAVLVGSVEADIFNAIAAAVGALAVAEIP